MNSCFCLVEAFHTELLHVALPFSEIFKDFVAYKCGRLMAGIEIHASHAV